MPEKTRCMGWDHRGVEGRGACPSRGLRAGSRPASAAAQHPAAPPAGPARRSSLGDAEIDRAARRTTSAASRQHAQRPPPPGTARLQAPTAPAAISNAAASSSRGARRRSRRSSTSCPRRASSQAQGAGVEPGGERGGQRHADMRAATASARRFSARFSATAARPTFTGVAVSPRAKKPGAQHLHQHIGRQARWHRRPAPRRSRAGLGRAEGAALEQRRDDRPGRPPPAPPRPAGTAAGTSPSPGSWCDAPTAPRPPRTWRDSSGSSAVPTAAPITPERQLPHPVGVVQVGHRAGRQQRGDDDVDRQVQLRHARRRAARAPSAAAPAAPPAPGAAGAGVAAPSPPAAHAQSTSASCTAPETVTPQASACAGVATIGRQHQQRGHRQQVEEASARRRRRRSGPSPFSTPETSAVRQINSR